jgi:predicted secreted acid phosphatase
MKKLFPSSLRKMNSDERGKCCFCGGECNPYSQSCGMCSRTLTGYAMGWNSLPPYLFPKHIKEREINSIMDSIPVKPTSVIVYDIDDTLLDLSGNPIQHIVNTYNYAKSKGFLTAIITARPAIKENIERTIKQLEMNGIHDYICVYFRPVETQDVARYKMLSRKDLHDRGYNVSMSIGDLPWDVGQYGGIGYIV